MNVDLRRVFICVGWFLGSLTATASAAERAVDVTPEVEGAWVRPDKAWDGRVVILMHGFADDRDGAGDLFKTLAGALAEHGIASLRINFRGEGDRRRTAIRSTFTSRVADAAAAVAWVRKQTGAAAKRVGAVGWSLGAATAIEAGALEPTAFQSLVVWSCPAGGDLHAAMRGGAFQSAANQAAHGGEGEMEIVGWKTVTLQQPFFESFRDVDLDRSLARYPGAFLAVRGAEDYLPQHDAAFLKIAPGRPAEAVLIGGADHVFNVFAPDRGAATRAVEATVAWFERTL